MAVKNIQTQPSFIPTDATSGQSGQVANAHWIAGWRQLSWPVDDNYLGRLRT
jgi:hypothetical protein